MIGIEINGNFLVINKNSSIRLENNYPSLFQGLYQGDFSFPFELDAESNYKILGFSNKIEASNKTLKFDCYIYLFGMPFKKAILLMTKTTKTKFQVNLVGGFKTLKTANKQLDEIDYGNPTYLGRFSDDVAKTATDISKDFDYTHYGFTFIPHINEDFYGTGNPDFKGVLNMVNPNTGDIYYNTNVTGNKYSLVPFFYLHFILQKIFDEEGLKPKGTFWDNPEMKKILVYNNRSLDDLNEIGDTKVALQNTHTVTSADFYSSSPFYITKESFIKGLPNTYDEPIAFNNTNHEYEITQVGLYTITFDGHVFLKGGTLFGFGFFVNNAFIGGQWSSGVSQGDHFYYFTVTFNATLSHIGSKITAGFYKLATGSLPSGTLGYVESGSTILIDQSNPNNLNLFSSYVYPKNHMKKMTVESFLLAVKQLGLEYTFDYSNNTVSIDFITDKFNSTSGTDWTDKAVNDYEIDLDNYNKGYTVEYDFGTTDKLNEDNFKTINLNNNIEDFLTFADLPTINAAGKTAFVKSMNQYFISVYDQYATPQYFWKKYTDYYYQTKYGDGETSVKLGFAPMLMGIGKNLSPVPNPTLETSLMPISKCSGSSKMFGIGDNDFDLRFVFLRGENMVGASPYNLGGKYIYASSTKYGMNGNLTGDWDFTLHESSGFYQKLINWVYELIYNGQLVEQDFRLNQVDILKLSETFKISVDGVNFILKTVSLMTGETIKISKAKMLKLS